MAARVNSGDDYRDIFGSSDEEGDSDLDFEGFPAADSDSEDSESEEEEEGAAETNSDDEEEWTADLSDFNLRQFSGQSGLLKDFGNDPKAEVFFSAVFGEESFRLIVEETNRYARQKLVNKPQRLAKWRDVTVVEMKAYFGLCIMMGINVLPKVADYWSTDPFLGNEAIRNVMPRNRFQEISQFLHFCDSTQEPARGHANHDRLYKVRPILSAVLQNIQQCYSPTKNIAIDEGMIAFKGRLAFRQYMPAKPTKYGIKVWMAADSNNGYVLNYDVYLGSEQGNQRIHGLGYDVVMKMARPYLNTNRHLYFDNFFSSPKLVQHLEEQNTYACSTVRCNRKEMPPCAKDKLRQPGELLRMQKGNLLFTKWHDKRDVAFLSTNVSPREPPRRVQRKKGERNFEIDKPNVADVYTKYMGGVDQADQLRSYYYAGRQSRKWYRYIFWFIFNLSVCNSHILESHHLGRNKRTQIQYRLELGKRLINGYNSRKRPPTNQLLGPNQDLTSHKSVRIDGRNKQCINCKKVGRKTPKGYPVETKFKCEQCGASLCQGPCFRDFHLDV
ncbi:hypothetical protein QZH41_000008 [Actinostola sp. cb2023]|nr:hypothetical protein QZH41_000008 [Actinostola sp. cb2023]